MWKNTICINKTILGCSNFKIVERSWESLPLRTSHCQLSHEGRCMDHGTPTTASNHWGGGDFWKGACCFTGLSSENSWASEMSMNHSNVEKRRLLKAKQYLKVSLPSIDMFWRVRVEKRLWTCGQKFHNMAFLFIGISYYPFLLCSIPNTISHNIAYRG